MHHFELARRDFFKLLGAGIAVFAIAKDSLAMQETAPSPRAFHTEELPKEISAWLHIGEDGSVTGFTGKAELGQNIRTSLAQTIADELRVPFESVRMVTGDTALTPFDAGTFGSRTTPTMTPQFRRVAAAARQLLIGVAAKEWNVAPRGISCRRRKSDRAWYGPLTELCGTCARQDASTEHSGGCCSHSGGEMDDRGQSHSESGRPHLCDGAASVHTRSSARRNAVR